MLTIVHTVLGFVLSPPRRDERGLSQSTENALLLAGAVAVAAAVVAAAQRALPATPKRVSFPSMLPLLDSGTSTLPVAPSGLETEPVAALPLISGVESAAGADETIA